MNKEKKLKLIQHYVANVAIGPTTLRNQGASEVTDKAREFLAGLELNELKHKQVAEYHSWLDKKTEELMRWFPDGVKDDWGGARKAVNLFMIGAYFNKILCEEYKLELFKDVLETPLDNGVAKRIRDYGIKKGVEWNCKLCSEDARRSCKKPKQYCGKSAFPGIINLKGYQSRGYQKIAAELAKDIELPRAEIDVFLCRVTDDNWEEFLLNTGSV
jgi:hypothetical protein